MAAQRTWRNGLVLTGGGARAAYQVGVLRAISHITRLQKNPFAIVSGHSAGAINGAWLASRCENFEWATKSMWQQWSSLKTEHVYRTDLASLSRIALKWVKDRATGGMETHPQITYLLDTAPLQKFLRTQIDFDSLNRHLQTGRYIQGLCVTATNYRTGHSTAFFQGHSEIQAWHKLNRISVRTDILPHHVMASSAIPIFFSPVQIGKDFFGDGMIRLNAPLSAPIHMGSDKLLVIGIRGPSSKSHVTDETPNTISLSEIAGTILNGLFFDALDADLARMERINRTLSVMTAQELKDQPDHLRHIPILNLKPSEEVAEMLTCELSEVPPTLRFLLKGIGLTESKGMDLLSYLLFEPKYLNALLDLGYQDTIKRRDQILEFLGPDMDSQREVGSSSELHPF